MRYVLAALLPPLAAPAYGGFRPFLLNLSPCIADMLLSNLGLMATCLYSGRIASAIIDFINIFPFTDASCSISITPVIPAFNIFFLPAIIHAIMMVIKRDKDKKRSGCARKGGPVAKSSGIEAVFPASDLEEGRQGITIFSTGTPEQEENIAGKIHQVFLQPDGPRKKDFAHFPASACRETGGREDTPMANAP